MNWHLYMWKFRLKSPLHVGFHKVMHFYRTRAYVPGKLLWGALTAKLTSLLGINDYQKVGEFLKKAIRFGYLYPYVEGQFYFPKYTENGLMFGSLSLNEFEKKFISSMASAAIEPESLTAEEGMLHEVEFVNPYTLDEGKPVYLIGVLWMREFTENKIELSRSDNKLLITYNGIRVDFKSQLADRFQIGGERRYGFGLLKLSEEEFKENSAGEINNFPGKWNERDGEVCISLS
ncbi:RAMP superfamily CRISPR-associated protein [Caldisericum exile]|uniref:RAMP superfamily CRISPR-associated protein n=1 Tax=Caldisericum exile TaxID=693075 RepID=UPI003C7843B8